MIFTGLAIFASAAALMLKLKRKVLLRALNYDLAIDVGVSAAVLIIHWGTFSGLMAATVAGLMTSIATSTAKWMFGYIRAGRYYPGLIYLDQEA